MHMLRSLEISLIRKYIFLINIRFRLEQRYEKHAPEVYRLLKNAQNYTREKIQELVKMGFGTREEIISSNFGPQDLEEKKKTLRQKMLRDLTGY